MTDKPGQKTGQPQTGKTVRTTPSTGKKSR
jgi:hypothetical protein